MRRAAARARSALLGAATFGLTRRADCDSAAALVAVRALERLVESRWRIARLLVTVGRKCFAVGRRKGALGVVDVLARDQARGAC